MRNVLRGCAWVLFAFSFPLSAESLYCPPSLEAPLQEGERGTFRIFPRGHLFQPLIADPGEPRFFLGYRDYDRPAGDMRVAVIGFGETFPLVRRIGDCTSDGVQLDIVGGGVARFLLNDSANDLIDTDFSIALPLSWRGGNWSARARIYHKSSHLGEQTLFQAGTSDRVKRSSDGLDVLASYDKDTWRIYYGGEYLFSHHPDIEQSGLHAGAEYYGPRGGVPNSRRWILGVDVKAYEEYDYSPDISVRTGLSFGGRDTSQHHLQMLLEWYDGHANEGVFFDEEIEYLGVGLYFGF